VPFDAPVTVVSAFLALYFSCVTAENRTLVYLRFICVFISIVRAAPLWLHAAHRVGVAACFSRTRRWAMCACDGSVILAAVKYLHNNCSEIAFRRQIKSLRSSTHVRHGQQRQRRCRPQ